MKAGVDTPALRALLFGLAAAACAATPPPAPTPSAASVTPVEKVITLLSDLKIEVEKQGQAEAGTYESFACFCKDTTAEKSGSITTGQDTIDTLSASIQEDTASQATKATELEGRKVRQGELGAELKATQDRCLKESAEFEAKLADLSKAVSSLDSALKALRDSKPSLISVRETLQHSLDLADAMSLIESPKKLAVQAFIQQGVDPNDPEYRFHSQGVIDTLQKLYEDFTDSKAETESERTKAKDACDAMKKSIGDDMSQNHAAVETLGQEIETLKTSIAENRQSLVGSEAMLKDDQTYLKDLTMRCESRAKTWDQRSELRAGELKALTEALVVLRGTVQDLDVAVNARAMLFESKTSVATPVHAASKVNGSAPTERSQVSVVMTQAASPAVVKRHLSFLQKSLESSSSSRLHATVLQRKQTLARSVLLRESSRLHSPSLAALAENVRADPFEKVKTLIQQLIERLLREATDEATKKGFCDEELSKAKTSRDFRWAELQKLSAELESLAAKKDALQLSIAEAIVSVNSTTVALQGATSERSASKAVNLETIAKAKEGLAAVEEAIAILKAFYKQAGKAKAFLQASPVNEDDPGAGFDGVYKGQQEASKSIFGLLEVIRSDFARTAKMTTADEKSAASEFVDFDRMSKASIAEQTKGKELNTEDLESTSNAIAQTEADMESAQSMLDSALKTIEDLKPMCIDNVMSFSERSQKRDEEIAALKKALCILDPDGVEEECTSP